VANYVFAPTPTFGISEHPFVTWENGFSSEEIDKLIEYCDQLPASKGTVGGSAPDEDISTIRESKVSWVGLNPDTQWIYDRLAFIIRQLNGQFYKFDIYGFSEDLQYTTYNEEDSGHYTWHLDAGVSYNGAAPRKLSVVVQLTDPAEYEGGDLELFSSANPTQVTKQKGLVAAFPSYMLHRVSPVTKGIRKTLVVWVCGPSFK
jgi:PKHD-type hydroxylase